MVKSNGLSDDVEQLKGRIEDVEGSKADQADLNELVSRIDQLDEKIEREIADMETKIERNLP